MSLLCRFDSSLSEAANATYLCRSATLIVVLRMALLHSCSKAPVHSCHAQSVRLPPNACGACETLRADPAVFLRDLSATGSVDDMGVEYGTGTVQLRAYIPDQIRLTLIIHCLLSNLTRRIQELPLLPGRRVSRLYPRLSKVAESDCLSPPAAADRAIIGKG